MYLRVRRYFSPFYIKMYMYTVIIGRSMVVCTYSYLVMMIYFMVPYDTAQSNSDRNDCFGRLLKTKKLEK